MYGSHLDESRTPSVRPLGLRPPNRRQRFGKRPRVLLAVGAVLGLGGLVAGIIPAMAGPAVVPVVPGSTQFDVTGFLQTATVDNATDVHSGGVLTVNGQTIVVPRETVVILPASAFTWQELFAKAPSGYAPNQTGMALADTPKPITTYEVHVVGNRVLDNNGTNGCTTVGGCDRMIAGMVNISQQSLNQGAGYINYLDYANGFMYVGGSMAADANGSPVLSGTNPGTRIAINDPLVVDTNSDGIADTGRFSSGSPVGVAQDARFQVDQDNPTIEAETGFPMCLPRTRVDQGVDDPLCPQANRPVVSDPVTDTSGVTPNPNTLIAGQPYELFRMDSPVNVDNSGLGCLRTPCADPRKQAPFEVGDYVTFAGSLGLDAAGNQYVSAHTVTASVGIYTQPGVNPAYTTIEVSLIGTGGVTVAGAAEAAVRTRFEGMSTDETRMVTLYGVDINPVTGATTDREWGSTIPDPGPPGGAVRGRWRFRPPCTATLSTLTPGKGCTPPLTGDFIPPTREVRAVINGTAGLATPLSQFLPGTTTVNPASQVPGTASATTTANGLFWGQYHAPIGEYIFPENVPGTVIPENNFNTIPFLAYGGYQSLTGVQAGVLDPWPSNVPPPAVVCAAPAMNGAPYSVANGGSIQLSGNVTLGATAPVAVQWTAGTTAGGTNLNGSLTNAGTTTPTFNATGLAAGTYFVRFSATNICGTTSVDSTITVTSAPAPTINAIQDITVTAGAPGNVTINASSPSTPTSTWAWTQTAGPALAGAAPGFTQSPTAATASATSSISFPIPSAANAGTYTFSVTATNANGTSSPTTVNVIVSAALPQNITFTQVEYRTSKQRLIITATSTDTTVTSMQLMPYLNESGSTFDPATLGNALTVNLIAPGSFTITLVGAPKPACNLGGTYATPCAQKPIVVKSLRTGTAGFVGTSAASAMLSIRR